MHALARTLVSFSYSSNDQLSLDKYTPATVCSQDAMLCKQLGCEYGKAVVCPLQQQQLASSQQ